MLQVGPLIAHAVYSIFISLRNSQNKQMYTQVCQVQRLNQYLILQDLRDSVKALKDDPNCVKDGKAPVYGMANINPDRSMVGEILVAVQDNLLD